MVDDEREVRLSTGLLLRAGGILCRPFASAEDFLAELPHLTPGCVIVDIGMPNKNGLVLMSEMRSRGCRWPAIVMTGDGNIPTAVNAMKLGAIDFLEKPFEDSALFASLEHGFLSLEALLIEEEDKSRASRQISELTERQREVLEGILRGASNDQIAAHLKISPRTVEMHRARMMARLGTKHVSEVVAIALAAGMKQATS